MLAGGRALEMTEQLLSKSGDLVRVQIDINEFTGESTDLSGSRENEPRFNNRVRGGRDGSGKKGCNSARVIVNSRGMMNGAERRLLKEVVIL